MPPVRSSAVGSLARSQGRSSRSLQAVSASYAANRAYQCCDCGARVSCTRSFARQWRGPRRAPRPSRFYPESVCSATYAGQCFAPPRPAPPRVPCTLSPHPPQLLVTFSCVAVFTFVPAVKQGVRQNAAVLWVAIAVSIGFLIALSCFPKVSPLGWREAAKGATWVSLSIIMRCQVAKRWPTNLVCLAGFTISEAYLVGAIASFSGSDAVILAVGGTVSRWS